MFLQKSPRLRRLISLRNRVCKRIQKLKSRSKAEAFRRLGRSPWIPWRKNLVSKSNRLRKINVLMIMGLLLSISEQKLKSLIRRLVKPLIRLHHRVKIKLFSRDIRWGKTTLPNLVARNGMKRPKNLQVQKITSQLIWAWNKELLSQSKMKTLLRQFQISGLIRLANSRVNRLRKTILLNWASTI